MTLTRLTLKNFQRWRKLVLDLDPRFTCLTGMTDAGKSSVLRALGWLATNQPAGDEFVTWGQDRCEVALELDGHTIRRVRGKGTNSYFLDDVEFKAFGIGVPPEVARLLAISGVNVQTQLDPPFWFSLTPGQVSQELNAVVDLSSIDRSLSHIATEVRKARSTMDLTRERLAAAQQTCTDLRFVPAMCTALQEIDTLRAQLDRTAQKRARLVQTFNSVSAVRRKQDRRSEARAAALLVIAARQQYEATRRRRQMLRELLVSVQQQRETLCHLATDRQGALDERSKIVGKTCPLCLRPAPSSRS